MRNHLPWLVFLFGLLALSACSGDEQGTVSTTSAEAIATTTSLSTSTAATIPVGGSEGDGDAGLVEVLATELEGGMLGPLPMDAETATCTAEEIVGSMEGGEGMSMEEYLASRDSQAEDKTLDLVLSAYFDCAGVEEVGNAIAGALIESLGLPAEGEVQTCLSQRLDSADEVIGVMGLDGGPANAAVVLEGCVGLGDVMSAEIKSLTDEEHACLNREGEDVLPAVLRGENDDMSRQALRTVLKGCGLDPVAPAGSGAE